MNNESSQLSVIIEYDMNEIEAKAYKISLIYIEKAKKFFPNEFHHTISSKKDPRKSYIFKHCYKLLRLYGEELKDNEIKLYVHAQFDILRCITKNQEHPWVGPEILSGKKSWNRWLLWKSKYDKVKKFSTTLTAEEAIIINKKNKIVELLIKTKDYLSVVCEKLEREKIEESVKNGEMLLWVRWGKVCYYYLLLSPIIRQFYKNIPESFCFDKSIYESGINEEIINFFRREFSYEF